MTFKKLLIGTLVAGATIPAQAEELFVVEDIRVRGLQRVALGAALTYIPVRVGDEVDEYEIRQSIRSLYSSTNFADIQARREGNTLVFVVRERPTISEIEFDGNSDIEDEQLSASLSDSGVIEGESLDLTSIADIEKGLEDFYHSVGKYNAQVDVNIENLPRNRVRVSIDFEEGDAAEIEQINIVGNTVFSEAEILARLELKDSLPWYNFIGEKRYQKQQLTGDLETLESFYKDRGYLTFAVESVQVSLTPNREGIYITVNINEGEQFDVRETSVMGDLAGHTEIVERIAQIESGTLYNAAQITFIEESIARFYSNLGYAYPEIDSIPEIDEENNEVDIVFSVNPGQRVYVNRINFSGNQTTKDEVLRREMIQMEGSWLSEQRVENSKVELERLGFFETVESSTERVDGRSDLVDINFDVVEQPSGSFNAGIGYGDYSGLQLNAGISQNNFLGTGNTAAFNVSTNKFQKSVNLSYTDSFFTKDGVSLSGNVFLSEFDAGNARNLARYNKRTYGVGTSVGFPINQNTRFNTGLTYKNEEVSNVDGYEQIRNFYAPYIDQKDPTSGVAFDIFEVSFGLARVTLNRGTFPTSGTSNRISFDITTPNSDVNYFRTNYDFKYYQPITDDHKWTLLSRMTLGYGNGYGSDDNGNDYLFPFFENFRIGGNQNLRGFEANTVGPRAIYSFANDISGPPDLTGQPVAIPAGPGADTVQVTRLSVGGNAMAVGGVELIFPVPFMSEGFENTIRTSIFLDVGTVWDTEFDYDYYNSLARAQQTEPLNDYSDPGQYRASAGISVQWISPMGPLTFSLGRPIRETPGDRTQTFTFNIGTTF
ncbi:MAG: outer membrane protein assembly factor BamA [Idiomarina sp.]